jgi:diacylglycerol kinase (ATP)
MYSDVRGRNAMENGLKGKSGLRRVWNAFGYSLSGLNTALRNEAAFRQEILLAVILIPIALFSECSGSEKALLVGSVMLVLIVELLNSAVENLTDRVSLEIHPLAKRAKDLGSAAVLMSLVTLASIWWLIFSG